MSKEQILVTPQQDLCAVVANASKNAEIVLAPGKYILNRPIVVDKTILMRGQTGKADDVMIGRDNATVLFVIDGKPTFQGIMFYAPASSDDAPAKTNEYDVVEYRGAVEVREKGNATFVQCKAISKQKNAFAACGKKARLTLEKCSVPNSGLCGVMVEGEAEALVKDSLIQNTGMACVDSDEKGTKVTVENSKLEKSGHSGLCAHNRGLLVARKCMINAGNTYGAYLEKGGRLEVESSSFYSEGADEDSDRLEQFGVVVSESFVKLTDCRMFKLNVGVYMNDPEAKIELKRVKMEQEMVASIVYDGDDPKIKVSNCTFSAPPIERSWLESQNQEYDRAKWNPEEFSGKDNERAYYLKTQYFEKVLGKEFPLVGHSPKPFYRGGALDAYYYDQSRYGGVFILTKELVSPEFVRPSSREIDAYELAIAVREPLFFDERGKPTPEAEKVAPSYKLRYRMLCEAAHYIWENTSVAQYHTIEFPEGNDNHYFIFDVLDKPALIDPKSLVLLGADAAQSSAKDQQSKTFSLDDALQMYSEFDERDSEEKSEEKSEENAAEKGGSGRRAFGVLVMIELHKSEIDYIREHEGSTKIFLAKLKEQNRWPFSDLSRPPIF